MENNNDYQKQVTVNENPEHQVWLYVNYVILPLHSNFNGTCSVDDKLKLKTS